MQQVLTDYADSTTALSAVYLEGRTLPLKVRALIDFAVSDIKTLSFL